MQQQQQQPVSAPVSTENQEPVQAEPTKQQTESDGGQGSTDNNNDNNDEAEGAEES